MQIERRALYNLLRMNWLMDSSIAVSDWQVEDYRTHSIEKLFSLLSEQGIELDQISFGFFADTVDTPEEMTEQLIGDVELSLEEQDQIYLVVFELWRRLEHEKPCLSVFCDELDYQIHLYDERKMKDTEAIEDAISNLQAILDENVDEGIEPTEAFQLIIAGCANDIETFLYDYITEQIENHHLGYASELLDAFKGYVSDPKWFAFLRVRMVALSDSTTANRYMRQLLRKTEQDPDLVFYLEVLSFLVRGGERKLFSELVNHALPLVEIEEDFQELLATCADFFNCLDDERREDRIQTILDQRKEFDLGTHVDYKDPDREALLTIID